jgi:hypothetical protein
MGVIVDEIFAHLKASLVVLARPHDQNHSVLIRLSNFNRISNIWFCSKPFRHRQLIAGSVATMFSLFALRFGPFRLQLSAASATAPPRILRVLQQIKLKLNSANQLQHLTSEVVREWLNRFIVVVIRPIKGDTEELAADATSITACSHECTAA